MNTLWRATVFKDDGGILLIAPDGSRGEWTVGPRPLCAGEVWVSTSIGVEHRMTKNGVTKQHSLRTIRLVDEESDLRAFAKSEEAFIDSSVAHILDTAHVSNVGEDGSAMNANAIGHVEYEGRMYDVVYFLRLDDIRYDVDQVVVNCDVRITLVDGIRATTQFINASREYRQIAVAFSHNDIIAIDNCSFVVADKNFRVRLPISVQALSNIRTDVAVDKVGESGKRIVVRRVGDFIVARKDQVSTHVVMLSKPVDIVIDGNGLVVKGEVFDLSHGAFDIFDIYEGDEQNGTAFLVLRLKSKHDIQAKIPIVDVIDGHKCVIEPEAEAMVRIPASVR